MKRIISIMVFLLFTTSCVSSKEYKARLADIENLKEEVSILNERLKTEENEKTRLLNELVNLKKDYEDLKRERDTIREDNVNLRFLLDAKKDELSKAINDLRARIEEKDREIAHLRKDIERLNLEKIKAIEEKEKAIAELKGTYDKLVSELSEEIKKGEIEITQLRDKLSLSMVEKILFDSGSAEIKKEGKKVLERVAEILKNVIDKEIRIEGHTDNVPIGTRLMEKFPTNWELSVIRATNVVRYLIEKGINPSYLSATGYSEFKPVAPNDTEENRAKNRRIEIVLVPIGFERIVK